MEFDLALFISGLGEVKTVYGIQEKRVKIRPILSF